MRFIIMAGSGEGGAKADACGELDLDLFARYMRFNEDLATAGVLVASEGLNPAAAPARVAIRGGKRAVVDGPYAEAKELVGGFYLIDVASREEAIEWALRCPVGLGTDDVLEIRQLTGEADIPPHLVDVIRNVAPTWSTSLWGSR